MHQALDPRQRYDPRTDFHTRDTRALEAGERVDHGGIAGVLQARDQGDVSEQEARRRLTELGADLSSLDDFNKIDEDLDWS